MQRRAKNIPVRNKTEMIKYCARRQKGVTLEGLQYNEIKER